MTSEKPRRVAEIFADALEQPAEKRMPFVARACGDDQELLAEVTALLRLQPDAEAALHSRARIESVDPLPTTQDTATASRGDSALEKTIAVPEPRGSGTLIGRKISHFQIEERLGAGGMGEVYRAHDTALDRPVALKVLQSGFKPWVRQRLLREAWASARLQHPGIATFFEAGQADGIDFIAMEYVSGQTLADVLADGPMEVEHAVTLVGGLLEALAHAHFYGILHRDIKPANIMVTESGAAKLLDLGLAKGVLMEKDASRSEPAPSASDMAPATDVTAALDETAAEAASLAAAQPDGVLELTQTGAVMGTLGYMPPEQLRGEAVDARADVFAMGAVLYETLAGQRAFPGRNAAERIRSILETDSPDFQRQGVSDELHQILRRALARNPSDRYRSAAEFLSDLRQTLGESPLEMTTKTLAIFDLVNTSSDEGSAWIGPAFSDSLAAMLGQGEDLRVLPRPKAVKTLHALRAQDTSATELAAGQQLGCGLILTGAYDSLETGLTVTVHLREVAAGSFVFKETFRGTREDLLGLQERFVAAISASVGVNLPETAHATLDVEAYELRARATRMVWSMDRGSYPQAQQMLERAIELEPRYARALVSLAHLHSWSYNFDRDRDSLRRAKDYAAQAIQIDPELAEAHAWMAYALGGLGDWCSLRRMARRAAELDPYDQQAVYFHSSGVWGPSQAEARDYVVASGGPPDVEDPHTWLRKHAVRWTQRAVQLNPVFGFAWLSMGFHQMELGDLDDARWSLGKAVEVEPKSMPPTVGVVGYLAECLRREGNFVAAREKFLEAVATVEKTDHMYRDTWRGLFLTRLGRTALDQGDIAAARAAFKQAELHLRGRAQSRASGHVMIQILAGLARAAEDAERFEAALQLFESRADYDFAPLWLCSDDISLFDLSRAAMALGDQDRARELFDRALEHGSAEARMFVKQAQE